MKKPRWSWIDPAWRVRTREEAERNDIQYARRCELWRVFKRILDKYRPFIASNTRPDQELALEMVRAAIQNEGHRTTLSPGWMRTLEWCKGYLPEVKSSTRLLHPFIGHPQTFVVEVERRGSDRLIRTILVKDVRLFGHKFILSNHLWARYNRKWCKIEPFFSGAKVVIHGVVVQYSRVDGTKDLSIKPFKIRKL